MLRNNRHSRLKRSWNLLPAAAMLLSVVAAKAQEPILWDGIRQLELSDFKSPATLIGSGNMYSLQGGAGFDFHFNMSMGEFMFAKNFNDKVICSFKPAASAMVAPDSSTAHQLLAFARFEFDLNELYARKFRKRIFEEKGAFSDVSFFRPAFDELQQELVARRTQAAKDTDVGRDEAALQQRHITVLSEIEDLRDFCRTCKPPRKRR